MIPKINSAHGSDTRNIINRSIEVLNQQGKSIQDLVAEGQLTVEQYSELIYTINGLVSKGEISRADLDDVLKLDIDLIEKELRAKAYKKDLLTQKGRIDTLLSLTEDASINDARLEDIKVGADGTVYDSPI